MSRETFTYSIDAATLSVGDLKRLENERIEQAVLIERSWWGGKVFRTEEDAVVGGLIEIPVEGEGYRVVGRIARREESRLLLPEAHSLLKNMALSWKEVCAELGLETNEKYLSITSLYRDFTSQQLLRETTYSATNGTSSHSAGAAIDIDPNGYYSGSERKPTRALDKDSNFNKNYMFALLGVLGDYQAQGRCNVIVEYGFKEIENEVYKYDRCYHVCLNPNFR